MQHASADPPQQPKRFGTFPGGLPGALAVLAFLLLRLGILLSAPDRLGHLGEGELGHANLALDLQALRAGAEGVLRPLWAYQVVPFHGGTWISSLLFVPFSAVFGLTWLSLKGLALAYATLTLLLWMWSLQRLAGPGAAALFGWLLALSPPVLVRMQLTLWGTHAEVSALQALGMAILVAGLVPGTGRPPAHRSGSLELGWSTVLGMSAGLAITFNYSAAVSSSLLLLAWVLSRRQTPDSQTHPPEEEPGRPRAPRMIPGFGLLGGLAMGLLPLLYLIVGGKGSLKVYEQGLGAGSSPGLLEGAWTRLPGLPRLLLELPPLSPQLPPGPAGELTPLGVLLHVLLFGAAAGVLWRSWRRWRDPTRMARGPALALGALGLYPFVFALTFVGVHLPFTSSSASTFGYCPRYAATLYPFLYASLAVATITLLRHASQHTRWLHPVRLVGGLLLGLFLLPSLEEDLRMLEPTTPTLGLQYDPLPLTKADLWAVDRRSIRGIQHFMQLEQARRVPSSVAQGFRALLTEPWSSEYWRFLESPPDGPTAEKVEARRQRLMLELPPEAAGRSGYAAGLFWAARVALGDVDPPAETDSFLQEDTP